MAMNIFEMVGNIEVKIDEATNSINSITEKAQQSTNKMTGIFKAGAAAIGAAFAIDKVIDFGKLAVNAAADAAALEAQFGQVFGNLQGEANKMIDGMASEFGMLPERLTPVFTQLTSKFKGLGVDSEEAMAMAERATTQAADAAANYDISMEDATDAINSYLDGNTKAGEKIGLYANQTQLASWAVSQGLISQASDWASLEDAQKQAMVLDYIDYTYELNGAMGQAANESDGFENVMGNLKAAWQKFLAVVGGPILKAVIPIIKGITDGVVWLADLIGPVGDVLSEWLAPLGDIKGMFSEVGKSADSAFGGLIDTFDKVKVAVESVWDLLTGGTVKENTDLMEQMGFSDGAIAFVISASEMIQGAIDEMKVAWDGLLAVVQVAWDNIKMVIEFFIDWYSTTFMAAFDSVSKWWKENQETILSTAKSVWDTIMDTLDVVFTFINDLFHAVWDPLVAWFNENQELIKSTISTVWNAILAVITFIMEQIVPAIIDRWNTIMEFLQPVLDAIIAIVKAGMDYILGIIKAIMQAINGDWSGAWETIKETANNYLSSLGEIVYNLLTKMLNIVKDKAEGMFNAIKEWFGKISPWIVEKWGEIVDFLKGINLFDIGANIINGLWNGIKAVWSDLKQWFAESVDWLPNWVKDRLGIHSPSRVFRDEIGKFLPMGMAEGIKGAYGYVEKAMAGMQNIVSGTEFSIPDVNLATEYAVKSTQTNSQFQANNRYMLEDVIMLLRAILEKDIDIKMNGRSVAEEVIDEINYLNELYNNRNTRIGGGFAQ